MNAVAGPSPPGEGPLRILLIEDEIEIARPLIRFLERQQYLLSHSTSGLQGIELAKAWLPHVVLLDLNLPDIDGIEVARRLREVSQVAIIMLTARDLERDRILGLESGADDYVVKPFGTGEVLARINAVLRRMRSPRPHVEATMGPLRLDHSAMSASLDGKDLALTQKEFEIMRMLVERAGQVVRREELARAVWNLPLDEAGKSLEVHLTWLRRKLGDDPKKPRYIETIRGVGVRLLTD